MKFTAGEAATLWLAVKFHPAETEDLDLAIEARALLRPWVRKIGDRPYDELDGVPDLEGEVGRELLVYLKKVYDAVGPRGRGLGGWPLDAAPHAKSLKTTLEVALAAANGKDGKK